MPALSFGLADSVLTFSGLLTISHLSETERELEALLEQVTGPLQIDLSDVTGIDTVGAWIVHRLLRDRPESRLEGASADAERLLEQVSAADRPCEVRQGQQPFWVRELGRLGDYVIAFCQSILALLDFIFRWMLWIKVCIPIPKKKQGA
jgi:phospholipid/cholesterol/gamma-HCH transport system permease protein